ncbi:hypothetical protein M495_19805 [Serratia liquefaciens ATCC 27592]|nr:hypothetical protein M495_19805 [Serratia liquefaciens ATCC 27592]
MKTKEPHQDDAMGQRQEGLVRMTAGKVFKD